MNLPTRIETLGIQEFMGVALYGNPRETSFCKAWELFRDIAEEAKISCVGQDLYGVQLYHPKFPQQFELTYLASVLRQPSLELPHRMLTKTLPSCKYAVQKTNAGIKGIDPALVYLYREYIPDHGYQVAFPFDFEKYCQVRDPETLSEEIEIWVPIRVK